MGNGPISSLIKDAKFRVRAYTCLIFRNQTICATVRESAVLFPAERNVSILATAIRVGA